MTDTSETQEIKTGGRLPPGKTKARGLSTMAAGIGAACGLSLILCPGHAYPAATLGSDAIPRTIETGFADMTTGIQPGCAIGVSRPGQPDLKAFTGYADLTAAAPIDEDTSFNIGSASKHFTAYAITLLERDGRLRTSDSIRHHLPELPPFTDAITIDDLLHHTGGVPNLELLIRLKGLVGNGTVPAATRMALLSSMRSWNQPPGMAYEYSNTGYFLLAQIVERIARQPFAAFMQQRVFQPAGMSRTIVLDAVRTGANTAQPYQPDGKGGFETGQSMQPGDGPSGVQSTLRDMLAWANYMLAPPSTDRAMIARMRQAGRLTNGEPLAYGRGLRLDHFNEVASVGHQGAWSSYRAEYRLFPDRRAAIVILCNRSDASPWEQADEMAGAMFPATGGMPDDARRLARTPGRSDEAPPPGLYRDRLAGSYIVLARDAGGIALAEGGRNFPILRESPGIFRARIDGMFAYTMRYAFIPGRGGAHDRLVARSFGEPSSYEKVEEWHPSSLDRYSGDYSDAALGLRVQLAVEGDSLVARMGDRTIPLRPLGRNEFGNRDQGVFLAFHDSATDKSFELKLPKLRKQIFQATR